MTNWLAILRCSLFARMEAQRGYRGGRGGRRGGGRGGGHGQGRGAGPPVQRTAGASHQHPSFSSFSQCPFLPRSLSTLSTSVPTSLASASRTLYYLLSPS